MSKSKMPGVIFLVLVVVVAVAYGVSRLKKGMDISARAAAETAAEAGERTECKARLALFYRAWKQYKADHKNAEPGSIQEMIPKYIPSPSLLECPTSVRLGKLGLRLEQGGFELDRQAVVVTYGFRWMTAGYPMQVKKQGDKIPLVVCKCHQEAMYQVSYKKQPREVTFDDEERAKLIPEVASAPILGVRRNGKVESLDLSLDR